MIWWTLALFVVSFLVTALLAPKPDIENARADSLDNVDFPRATEDAPIPLILGKVRFNAPNTIWYGDYAAVAITERIKVSIFKKVTIIVGYKYYLGLDLALAMGPAVQMHEILIDDTSVWTGSTSLTLPTTGSLSANSLFGGYKEGGGFSSSFTYYPGAFNQPVNAYLEGQNGVGNVPGYRGLAHLVFEKAYIGESAQLRKTSFILSCYTNALGSPGSGLVGEDMNPMEAIYQVMTDQWRGLGVASVLIDIPSFQAAATILHAEGNGVSILVTAASTGKTVIAEILRQIDAIMYQDPETGKFVVKLIRFDYDPGTLPVYDEDDVIQIRNFTKTSWEDVIAQVKVSFPTREKESTSVAVAQDLATATMMGRLKTSTLSFPFCYTASLANAIAARELSTSSVPLFRATIEMNRNGYALRPGDVFVLDWPEYGVAGVVFRVQKHDLGALMDNKIVLECLQDSFAQSNVVFSPPAVSGWTPPITQPVAIATFDLLEQPRFLAGRLTFPVPDGFASVIPLPLKPTAGSTGFDMVVGNVSGTLDIREPAEVEYPASGTLQAAYARTAGFTGIDATGFVVANVSGVFNIPTGADLLAGDDGLIYVGGEWMSYSGVTGAGATVTLTGIRRALFGTRPLDHALGARVWAVNSELTGSGVLGEDLLENGTAYYKLLDRIGGTVFAEASAAQQVKAMADIADRPLRPRNVQLDGSRTPTITNPAAQTCTWVASNRNKFDAVTYEQDAAQTPDVTETYDIKTFFNGVEQVPLRRLSVPSGTTIPFHLLPFGTNPSQAEVRVNSIRTAGDFKSSVDYAVLPIIVNIALLAAEWNPADKDASIVISNVGRTIAKTGGAGWRSVRSLRARSTGKFYVEFNMQFHTASFIAAGFATSAAALSNYVGAGTTSLGIVTDGNRYTNGVATATIAGFANTDVLCCAIDLDARLIWFRKNGLAWNTVIGGAQDPAAGTGGIALPAGLTGGIFCMGSVQVNTDIQTANFAAANWAQAAPAGYGEW